MLENIRALREEPSSEAWLENSIVNKDWETLGDGTSQQKAGTRYGDMQVGWSIGWIFLFQSFSFRLKGLI